jgi:hypothetical protein
MADLIDRDALLQHLRDGGYGEGWVFDQIRLVPTIKPQIVANISGGVLQGASSDYRVDLYTLDFDLDTFDHDATGIMVDGDLSYFGQVSPKIDPDFVERVVEADTVFLHNGAQVCGQCDGDGETQSMSNLELEVCPVCDGSGELPE